SAGRRVALRSAGGNHDENHVSFAVDANDDALIIGVVAIAPVNAVGRRLELENRAAVFVPPECSTSVQPIPLKDATQLVDGRRCTSLATSNEATNLGFTAFTLLGAAKFYALAPKRRTRRSSPQSRPPHQSQRRRA